MNIIVSPHCDDELIGCYEVLAKQEPTIIVYTDVETLAKRREEALTLKDHFTVTAQFFHKSIPQSFIDNKESVFYFPDPIYETHPMHRKYGAIGEEMARSGKEVIFYSVNMQAPYIHELVIPEDKKELMDQIYPSQKDLWSMDNRYFLFEGRCKWMF